MFTVYEKSTNEEVKVYDVKRDKCGYPQFLICKRNEWKYRSAKYYSDSKKDITYEEVDKIIKKLNESSCNHNYEAIYKNNFQPPYFNDETLYRCVECGHEYWV